MRLLRRRTHGPDALSADPRQRPRRAGRKVTVAAVGTGMVVLAAAATTYVALDRSEVEQAAPIHAVGPAEIVLRDGVLDSVRDRSGDRAQAPPRRTRTTVQPGSPRRLVIPRLDVDSAVVPITASGGVLTPPDDAQQVGWWSPGAEPGAAVGSALLTGHTLSSGGAALQDLETLETGDRIAVQTSAGLLSYRVDDVQIFSKGAVAAEAGELFSQSAPGRLVVVTCEDFDGSTYLSNVVVTATPIGRSTGSS